MQHRSIELRFLIQRFTVCNKKEKSFNLNALCTGAHVMEMVVVVSAWSGARLQDCRQPFVSIRDPASGASLCEYHLESRPRAELADKTAVVMCRIHRASRTNAWEVQAVGQVLASGYASNYGPILQWIGSQGWAHP